MTELRENLTPLSREWFKNLFEMVESEGRGIPGFTAEQAMAELEPHLAFIAGGSGEVSEEAKTQALAAGGVVFFEQAGAFEDAVIAALTAAYTIDRPASAVVKPPHFIEASVCRWRFTHLFGDAEIVQTAPSIYRLDVCFNDELDGKTFSSLKGAEEAFAADYTRRILSAVNAVSEAQVQADERERLAKRAAKLPALVASDDPSRSFDVAQWLRAQEGGK